MSEGRQGAGTAPSPRDHLVFFVNGAKQVARNIQPETTLLQYLRNAGLTGTKLGCGEGGCGACTVMVSAYDHDKRKIKHAAVNACLAPVCSVDWCHVTTVEGVGSMRQGVHPIQKRIAEMHGSQCGFCTPGIVMALYALLRSNPSATAEEIEAGLDGNFCRCTGYRPILDAAKSLGVDGGAPAGCCRSGGGGGGGGGCPCFDGKAAATTILDGEKDDIVSESSSVLSTAATDGPSAPSGAAITAATAVVGTGFNGSFGGNDKDRYSKMDCTRSRGRDLRFSERYTDASEPIFPASLMLKRPSPVTIAGDTVTWHFPTALEDLVGIKTEHPQARIVAGNTEVGIETKFEGMHYPVLISPSRVPELHAITVNPDGSVFIGGAASLSAVEHALSELDGIGKDVEGDGGGAGGAGAARACVDMLRWFASTQIRNVACLAGNLATASPISDMKTLLAACGADVIFASTGGNRRTVKVRDCFLGGSKYAMEPHEVILGVTLPNAYYVAAAAPTPSPSSSQFEFVRPFKQARRRQNGASIVTAGLRVRLEPREGKWVVLEAGMCFGGMAAVTVAAPLTEAYLADKEWSAEVIEGAYQTLAEDLPLPPNAPGGQSEYRRALPPSFLFKFFVFVSLKLEALSIGSAGELPPPPVIGDTDRSAATNFITDPKPASRGQQEYTPRTGGMQKARPVPHVPIPESREEEGGELKKMGGVGDVGKEMPHKSSTLQVTGEAVYTDDIPSPVGTLYAGLILSTKPHAKLLGVDPSEALKLEGVVRYVGSADVAPERIAMGPLVKDEEVFAVSEVHCVGQIIGTVLADTPVLAKKAAKLVTVRYEELPTIMTIDEAIAADSFYAGGNVIVEGDAKGALDGADVVVDGELKIGAQEHFYLETNTTLVVPGDDGSLEILAATQDPEKVQSACASVCGVDLNKVVCRCKRLGGAFGGKGPRSVFLSCAVALSAHVTGRPVRLSLDRDVDMQITGHRHAFLARYRAGATKNGKLGGMEVNLYSNAGCSLDVSSAIMNTAILQIDNCYRWPTLKVEGFVCKTNQASHTSFRGFGAPQAMLVTETVMDHLATSIGIDPFKLRTDNMYKEGDSTFYGQPLNAWNVRKAWADMRQWAEIERRRKEVDAFNAGSRWRKRGLSVIPTKLGICFGATFLNQGGALVHVYQDGTVLVTHGGTEMGQGLHTKICQVVASAFGIETEKVHVAETATDKVANASPTGASVSIDLYGMAALDACEQITERLEPIAAQLPPGSPFAYLVTAAYFQRVNLSAQGFYKVPCKCQFDFAMDTKNNAERGPAYNYFTQGVAASEVEVDCLTGDVKVLRADILMDIGASINPAIDIGQIEGGFVQGYGWCTMEETTWGDAEHPWAKPGQLLTRGPGTYKIPSSNDVPSDMRVKLMDKKNAFAVHSSKGVGEPPFFMASSAFFAIKDAVASARRDHGEAGYFVLNSPASSERIRTACLDGFMERSVERSGGGGGGGGGDGDDEVKVKDFQAKGSW